MFPTGVPKIGLPTGFETLPTGVTHGTFSQGPVGNIISTVGNVKTPVDNIKIVPHGTKVPWVTVTHGTY